MKGIAKMTSTPARTCTLLLFASAMFWPAASGGQTLTHDSIRGAATRAVAAIEASQSQFVKKTACTSCHHQFQPAIAFAAARAHGIPVDEEVAALNAARSFDFTDIDAAVQFSGVVEPALQEGYRLIAAHASGVRPNLATALLARILMARQREAGDWSGLNQRPPSSSSDFAKTALGLRAVQLHHHRADTGAAAASIARASGWLATHDAPDTEGRTYQLLGLHWSKGDGAVIRRVGQALAAAQRPDGGWGSIDGRASEAYSTGEALVALREAGVVTTRDAVWQRGIAFLVRTQASDGSWHVPSRLHAPARLSPPYFESGYPYGHDQFISVAGAAWAVMALADSLPLSTRETTDQAPAATTLGAEAWVETVAFGSLDDLRAALDGGFDPNSKTTSGGTTPLMAAAGDVAKVRLLLDRGADLTRRAASGYSALMTAAQYGRNDAVLDLLLERGALAAVAAEAVPGRQYALSLAVHAGNDAAVRKLHAAGEPVNEPFRLSKTNGPVMPMAMAVRNGDLAVVRTLLDLGVPVEGGPGEAFSPLESAVHNDRLDLARLFLERGADVNRVGRTGYTPLMFAASIDFGQTDMLDLLLSAGARVDIRNPAGKTAVDLAKEYQHPKLAARLVAIAGTVTKDAP